jgi:glycine dehydrogenase
MYAVYHGPEGLRQIADRVHGYAKRLAASLKAVGHSMYASSFFDTVTFTPRSPYTARVIIEAAARKRINIRVLANNDVSISLDETVSEQDLFDLAEVCGATLIPLNVYIDDCLSTDVVRTSPYLKQEVFNRYRSESEFLRYIKRLEAKDLSLCHSMIPLGSCTMKLNASAEMLPVSWSKFSSIHPFAPANQVRGYKKLFSDLEESLAQITGFKAVSLQPNAGSQGEYAGLLVIRAYHQARGEGHRLVCLIPKSAHGTNPASAIMAGFQVVVIDCDDEGNIDISDLRRKAELHASNLAALMITYPSTHGVFEKGVLQASEIIHSFGGQVYMDGANLNALVGLVAPAELGMDVCHINLHKTFCIPHGGGGPGMGPIAVAEHLAPFIPSHPLVATHDCDDQAIGPISSAPWGSASILPISWMYIALMGQTGLREASCVAIANANYMVKRLEGAYPVLYRGESGFVAHECILDCRAFKNSAGVDVGHIARRLMDYGFHAPTISWPVPGTMMIEPTESEGKDEIDRYCEALISIREEIRMIEEGIWPRADNPLINAPHTAFAVVSSTEWSHPYSREKAVFPTSGTRINKFWPAVGAIDAAYGDRNLVCSCEPLDS